MSTAAERKAAEKAQEERIAAEEAAVQPQPTPVEEPTSDRKSPYTEKPVENVVGDDYPERPYAEAVSEKHLAFLAERHPHRLLDIGVTPA